MGEATDNIMLFGFNNCARIGAPARNMGTPFIEERDEHQRHHLHPIRDDHSRRPLPLCTTSGPGCSSVLNMESWVKHPGVRLDEPVTTYRAELNAWVLRRTGRGNLNIFTDASDYVDWPDLPEPTRRVSYANDGADSELEPETYPSWAINRRDVPRTGVLR